MRRFVNYIIFLVLITIISIFDVNAECSYNERKELLNNAKNVDIFIELKTKKDYIDTLNIETGEVESKETEVDYFQFNIANLSKDLYIKVYNSEDADKYFYIFDYSLENGIYKFEDKDTMRLIKYYFEIYSNKSNCLGYDVKKVNVIKPKYNAFSDLELCKLEQTKNHKYCKKYIDKNYKESDMYNTLQKLKSEKNKNIIMEEENKFELFFKYWYIFVLFILLIIILSIFLLIRRKKNEL